ncbi:MAG: hypothetical protein AMXMBFR47_00390 [Planctomycetota bacterium]
MNFPSTLLRLNDIPRMSRPTFVAERNHMFLFGIFAGIIEGNTSAIVVSKTFEGSYALITAVWITPMIANVLTLLWGVLLRGRPRQRVFQWLIFGAVASFLSIALTPADWRPWGGWIFFLQIAAARIFLVGVLTVRTSMWGMNYPKSDRARITARLQSLRFTVGLFATAGIARLFDQDAGLYRWLYPLVGVIGILSVIPVRQMRVRGEARELRRHLAESARLEATTGKSLGLVHSFRECLQILKRDAAFSRYCTAMFFLGASNFMIEPIVLIIATQQLGYSYLMSSFMLDLFPNIIMLASMPMSARYFDRVGVLPFRVVNSAVWLVGAVAAAVGAVLVQAGWLVWLGVGLLWASRFVNGFGRGGGAIAWNLGHLHFAGRDNADLYLGIHVTLTGLRGLVMPVIAIYLFKWIGGWSLAIAVLLGIIAVELFRRLQAFAEPKMAAERAATETSVAAS